MKLELNKKWKWAAKDQDGDWHLFDDEPAKHTDMGSWLSLSGATVVYACLIFSSFPPCNWEDSLHEIKDGELVRPEDNKDEPDMIVTWQQVSAGTPMLPHIEFHRSILLLDGDVFSCYRQKREETK